MSELCAICKKVIEQSGREYCPSHEKALAGIEGAYLTWLNAYGKLGFKEYLERVRRLPEMGERARQAAKFLAEHSERWNKSKP